MDIRTLALHLILALTVISCAHEIPKAPSGRIEKIEGKAYVFLPEEIKDKQLTYYDKEQYRYTYGEALETITIDFFTQYFKDITVFSNSSSKLSLIGKSVYFFEVDSDEKILFTEGGASPGVLNTVEVRLTIKLVRAKKEIYDSGTPITVFRARKKDTVYGPYTPLAIKAAIRDCFFQIMPEIKRFIEKGPPTYRTFP